MAAAPFPWVPTFGVTAPVTVRSDTVREPRQTKEIVLIDTAIAQHSALEDAVPPGVGIVAFGGTGNGLRELAHWALSQEGYDAIHLISHGSEGVLVLGADLVSMHSLSCEDVQVALAQMGRALKPGGDLLLYGCNVAGGATGKAFVHSLSLLTGARVAAATGLVGDAALGGSWALEYQTAPITATSNWAHSAQFSEVLAYQSIGLGGAITSGSLASGTFVINGLSYSVSSDSGFTVTQENGGIRFRETAATGNFSIAITDTGGNSQFSVKSMYVLNESSGGDSSFGAQGHIYVYDGAVSQFSVSLPQYMYTGNDTAYLTNTLDASGTTYIGTRVVIEDTEINNVPNLSNFFIRSVEADLDATNDTTAPTVTGVSATTSNGTYKAGDVIAIQMSFSEAVYVSGSPQLMLETGASDGVANYLSGSGSSKLLFQYTVRPGDLTADLDYTARTALALNGGSIKDAASNAAVLMLPSPGNSGSLGASKAIVIDGVSPQIGSTGLPSDGIYGAGQSLDFTVQYSEAVVVNQAGGTPYLQLTLDTGATARASYVSGSGSDTLTFRYIVAAGDLDANGIEVASSISLSNGTIKDAAGNNAALTGLTYAVTAGIQVDGVAPLVTGIARVGSEFTNASSVQYQVTFAESVTGIDSSDFVLTGTGTATGQIASVVGSGANYTATVTGLSGAGTLRLDLKASSTGIVDMHGNAIVGGFISGEVYTIDTFSPTVASVTANSADGTYGAGDLLVIEVHFGENVQVTGIPTLALSTGGMAVYGGGSGTNTLTFNYIVQAGEQATRLDYASTNALSLQGGNIRDKAGNAAVLTLHAPAGAGSLASQAFLVVDGVSPAVAGLIMAPAGGLYGIGKSLEFTVAFDEAVTLTGTGSVLQLDIGGTTREAVYSKKTATSVTYVYTVQAGDQDADGIDIKDIQLHGSTLRDAAGNSANLSLSGHRPAVSNLKIDGIAPTLDGLIGVPVNGVYGVGKVLTFSVPLSKSVTLDLSAGAPALVLTVGSESRDAVYNGAASTPTSLVFNYTVQAGDADANGIGLSHLDLRGAVVTDGSGNALNVSLAGHLPSSAGVLIDTTDPVVTSVNVPAIGVYAAGQALDFTVNFDEHVVADTTGGTPRLALTVGSETVYADYVSGSGSSALVFRTTVADGWSDTDGISVVALQTHGGTLQDAGGNSAQLVLGSVGDTTQVLVDGIAPEAPTIHSAALTNSETPLISGTAESGSTVHLTIGGATYTAIASSGAWSVDLSISTPVSGVLALNANGGNAVVVTATDPAGNTSMASTQTLVIDIAAPAFNPAASVPAAGGSSAPVANDIVLAFDEVLDATQSDLSKVFLREVLTDALVTTAVSINANGALVINPVSDLAHSRAYYVTWDAGALKDLAGNAAAVASDPNIYQFSTVAAPASGGGATPPLSGVDGAEVTTGTAPDGSTVVTIAPVQSGRAEDPSTANADLADVPLINGGDGHAILQVGLPVGVGLQAQGQPNASTGGAALAELVLHIQQVGGSSDVQANGQLFVSGLGASAAVHVQTVVVSTGPGFDPSVPLVITGSTEVRDGLQAVILDARSLPAGSVVRADHLDFIAVVGAVRLVGGAGQNVASGDGNEQWMVLGADDDLLHGGGGNDIVGSLGGNDQVFGDAGDDIVFGGTGNDILSGGSGNDWLDGGVGWDTALQSGSLADYTLSQERNALVLTHKTTGEKDHLKSVELVKFDAGPSLHIALNQAQAAAAHIATHWLGRDLTPEEGAELQGYGHLTPLEVAQAVLRGPAGDTLQGHSAWELIADWESNPQVLRMDAVSEVVQGSAGSDAVQYGQKLADGHLQYLIDGVWEGTDLTNGDMVDLRSIERVHFTDASVALDGAHLAALMAVTLGEASLQNRGLTTEGLALMDGGWSQQDIGAAALKLAMGSGAHTAQETVQWLWTKAHGNEGTAEQLQPYVQQLEAGVATVGQLAWEAAQYALAHPQVGLTGVLQQGLVYEAV